MPPRKNIAPSNAVRTFSCDICNKGYPRQPDYENHLRSYDHNHRERLANMKKLTARNDPERERKPGPGLLRSVPGEVPPKRAGGPRFSKVGGGGFQKVGVVVKTEPEKAVPKEEAVPQWKEDQDKMEIEGEEAETQKEVEVSRQEDRKQRTAETKSQALAIIDEYLKAERSLDADEAMMGTDDDWEPYDFRRPTGCDPETCSGCEGDIWNEELPNVDMQTFMKQLLHRGANELIV